MSKRFVHNHFSTWATRCWYATLVELRGTTLSRTFADFVRRFPDHPTEDNTWVYLAFLGDGDQSPPSWTLSWWCSHFEYGARDDLVQLIEFMDGLAKLRTRASVQSTRIETLSEDRLHVSLDEPAEGVRNEVIQHGRELQEWAPPGGKQQQCRSSNMACNSRFRHSCCALAPELIPQGAVVQAS